MANIKSAKKRIKVSARQRKENKFFRATVNTYIKKFRKLIAENNFVEAEKLLIETTSLINSSASKGVYHKNNASRKISRLSSALHKAKTESGVVEEKSTNDKVEKVEEVVAPVESEKVEEKPAAKKATATKKATTTAKKAADKKDEPAKKTATAKKAPAKTATTKKVAEKKAPAKTTTAKTATKKAPAKTTTAKTATKKTPAKKTTTEKAE